MKKFCKYAKWFILHIEELISCVALATMICGIMINVVMRYIFRNPLSWADELAVICMAYVTFVGSAVAYKRNLHYGIDVLIDKLPSSIQLFIRRVTNFIFIFLFAYTTYLGYQLTTNNMKLFHYTGWSYKIMDIALPIGFLSMTVYAVYFFVQSFTNPNAYKQRYDQTYEMDDAEETVSSEKNVKEAINNG